MSLLSMLKGNGANGFGYGSTAEAVTEGTDLTSKTYLLTGSNSGIGKETLRVLGLRGAKVVALARSVEDAEEALASQGTEGEGIACDLSEPKSIRECVDKVKALDCQLDGIICNAGIMALPKLTKKYGVELQFLTNHVGHFMLVTGLLERLTENGRIVVVSSHAHRMTKGTGIVFDNLRGEGNYSPWNAYGQSKLANILFAKGLAKRFKGSARTANALHPGVINTNLGRHMNPMLTGLMVMFGPVFLKNIPQGAATQCYLAAHPDVASVSGQYFADVNPSKTTREGEDDNLVERLWTATEEIVDGFD